MGGGGGGVGDGMLMPMTKCERAVVSINTKHFVSSSALEQCYLNQ